MGETLPNSNQFGLGACLALLVSLLNPVAATIISSGDGSGNTSNPPDDPGWNNVGRRGSGSAVYLGNRWALTANHVGPGTVVFPSGSFSFESESDVRLQNPPGMGLSTFTDLKLFQLVTAPALPTLKISPTPPPVGGAVTMIGNGRDRLPDLLGWDVALSGPNWIWTPVTPPEDADIRGFGVHTVNRSMRWGNNLIEDDTAFNLGETDPDHNIIINAGAGDVITLLTEFDENGTSSESHAASGDSGGGVFFKNGNQWELSAIMDVILDLHDQPANTAVMSNASFSGDLLFSADLTFYRDQILGITGIPEPTTSAVMSFGLLMLVGFGRDRRVTVGQSRRRQLM